MPYRAFKISFAFEINNLAIHLAENRTPEPYTIRGGCGQACQEARNLRDILPNPATRRGIHDAPQIGYATECGSPTGRPARN